MSAELLPAWSQIEKYVDDGMSIIPVHDKDGPYGAAKSPCAKSWKPQQTTPLGKQELFDLMDVKYNTTAVGIIGGEVSGNLEMIDIDVQYKPGIDAILFTDLKTLRPDISEKLRIHKTPSGGSHILYRCEEPIPGNQKLAGRNKTKEELSIQPRPTTVNFIETRGEGGYIVAPPAMGYEVIKDCPIPVLSKADRNFLISLCRSYNEIIKVEKPPKPSKEDDFYYDTNPFEDFNNRVDPTELTECLGWKYLKSNNHFIWYTRPGKTKGVSMSFNLQKRFFYCFTASTELEESHGYTPANLLAAVQFDNDKKKLYQHLVLNGYGKIKPATEQRMAKKAAVNKKPLPANASEEAKKLRDTIEKKLAQQHPFGMFWFDSREGVKIDRERLSQVAAGLGFMLWRNRLIYSDGIYIEEAEDRFFYDTLKQYIKEEDANFYNDICNAFESFIERHGKFTITRLPILPDSKILSDTAEKAYKCYLNGVLCITAETIELLPAVPLLIWKHSVQPRNFIQGDGGRFIKFLNLAMDFESNRDYLLPCIGYLAHEYKDETTAYIIVLTEKCENPKDGGGAGKNVFSALFKHTTTVASKPGEQTKYDEKFMQSWNFQKIFCISDAPKNFNFLFLKELSSGIGVMKKLFKDESEIPNHLMPKFLVQTNYSIEIKDGGLARRVKIIEFTDFFTKAGGIDVHFGVHFPNGWDEKDWAGYDTLISQAIQYWLKGGRKIGEAPLSESGWLKQFEQSYGAVIAAFVKEKFSEWVSRQRINNTEFKNQLETFHRENNTPSHYQPSMFKINQAIGEYCKHHGVEYKSDVQRTENGIHNKYREFIDPESLPF